MLKEFIQHLVRSLIEHKEDVVVTRHEKNSGYFFEIKVHEQDLGRVIGKNGQTIRAIRTLVFIANKDEKPVTLDIAK